MPPLSWGRWRTRYSRSSDTRSWPASPSGEWRVWAMTMSPSSMARSEEHTSELQSLMRISYAVFCLKKKKNKHTIPSYNHSYTKQKAHTSNQNINSQNTWHIREQNNFTYINN